MKVLLVASVSFGALLLSGLAFAQKPNQGDGERRPPKEAIAACASLDEGASVSFTSPRGDTISGSCETRSGQLVAVPEGHKDKAGGGRNGSEVGQSN